MLCLARLWEGKNRGACGAGSKATRYRRPGYTFSLCALFVWYEMTQKVHHSSSYPVCQSKPPQQPPGLCHDALSLPLWAENTHVVV